MIFGIAPACGLVSGLTCKMGTLATAYPEGFSTGIQVLVPTFRVEAILLNLHLAPGLHRKLIFERSFRIFLL